MQLSLEIYRDQDGGWLFKGLPNSPVRRFQGLSEGLEWAERECSSAPALIELHIDGFYAVVHQEQGWPHKLCRPASGSHAPIQPEGAGKSRFQFGHMAERLRRRVPGRDVCDALYQYLKGRRWRGVAGSRARPVFSK